MAKPCRPPPLYHRPPSTHRPPTRRQELLRLLGWSESHLWQWHAVDDEVRLLRALASEGVVIAVVGRGIARVLVLHVEEGALRAPAPQGQGLLVVVEVVERGGERRATHHVHLVRFLHVPRHQADVVLAQLFLLAGLLLVAVGVLRHPVQVEETEQTQ